MEFPVLRMRFPYEYMIRERREEGPDRVWSGVLYFILGAAFAFVMLYRQP